MAVIVEIYRFLAWQDITFDIPFLGDDIPGLIPFELELTRESNIAVLRFSVNHGSYSEEPLGREIRVSVDGTQIFGGYLTTRERIRYGTLVGANYECQDYNSIMDRIVVTGYTIDAGDTDSTEIEFLRADKLAGIGVTAGTINTVEASMPELYLQGTFRQAMEAIAAAAGGAHFYIDQDKQLNYVAATSDLTTVAPEVLDDDPTVANSYQYADLVEREDETRKIDRVFIIGNGITGWYPAADSGEVYQAIIQDDSVTTQAALDAVGAAIVDDFGSPLKEYSLRCWEDAFWGGERVTVTHSNFISGGDTLFVRRMIMRARSSDCDEREYILEMGDHTVDSDSFSPSLPGGGGGGMGLHPLLFNPWHSDTDDQDPTRGDLILANDTPEWTVLNHPSAAGYALTTDANDVVWDQTPTWTGTHTWDDGAGDSPSLVFVGGSNDDTFEMWLEDDAAYAGNSDFVVKFPAADTDTRFIWRDSGDNDVAHVDGDGNTTWDGTTHRFGVADSGATTVTISGAATGSNEGAQINLELADDHDAVFGAWIIDINTDDLRFWDSGASVVNRMTAEGQLWLPTTGSGAGVLIGGDAQWYRSAANQMATPDDLYLAGAGLGIIHVDGVANGQILVANNTRYVPGTIADAGGAPDDAQYLTLALDGDLSAERRFVPGDGLAGTDGGANGDYDLVVDLVAAWSGLEFSGGDLRIDLDATFDAWTGVHTHSANVIMDDGAGNSPAVRFLGGSNDDAGAIYLRDDAVAGNSDLTISLCADDADSRLEIRNASLALAAWIDATGDALFADITTDDVSITTGHGIIHADGVAAGQVLVANGASYVPGDFTDIGAAPDDAQYLTLAADGDLDNERVFTPGDGLAGTDNGAGLAYDLVVDLVAAWSGLEFSGGDLRIDLDATFDAWTATHTHAADIVMDDGASNSPWILFVGGSNDDTAEIWLTDDAVAGNSDLNIRLCADDADSILQIRNDSNAIIASIDATGDADFADVTIDEYLYHDGDADTYLRFQDDNITLASGGWTALDIVEGVSDYVIVNSTTADSSFSAALHVTDGNIGVSRDGDPATIHLFAYGTASTDFPIVRERFARGSRGTPTAAQSGDLLGRWGAGGYGATAFAVASTAWLEGVAAENFTDAAMGTHLDFYTTPASSVVATERLRLTASGRAKFGGTAGASAQVDIDQSSATGGIAVLRLDQADIDQPFVRAEGEADAGNLTYSLVDEGDQSSETRAGWLLINIQDAGGEIANGNYYVPFYTLA